MASRFRCFSRFITGVSILFGAVFFVSKLQPNHRTKTRLLLVAYYRGGSSLLGDIFGQNPDAFYLFEPLHAFREKLGNDVSPEVKGHHGDIYYDIFENGTIRPYSAHALSRRTHTLSLALSCRISRMDLAVLKDNMFMKKARLPKMHQYRKCRQNNRMHTRKCAKYLNQACRNSSIVAVKTIRLPVNAIPTINNVLPNVKVIHYVRDPRGILSSRWHLGKVDNKTLHEEATKLCLVMAENHRRFLKLQASNPANYLWLRYEDLALHTKAKAKQLYTFVGHSVPDTISGWIMNNTRATDAKSYGTARDSEVTVYKWTSLWSPGQLRIISRACRHTLSLLGYSRSAQSYVVWHQLMEQLKKY